MLLFETVSLLHPFERYKNELDSYVRDYELAPSFSRTTWYQNDQKDICIRKFRFAWG